jgi:hypothetical protein
MRSKQLAVLIALLLVALAASADDLERRLSDQYRYHVLGLRAPVAENGQDFDSAGNPLNSSTPPWMLHSGLLFVQSVRLNKDMMELKGDPVISANRAQPQAFVRP